MPRWDFSITGLLVLAAGVAFGMAPQNHILSAWPAFEAGTVTHETRSESQTALPPLNVNEIPPQAETGLPQGSVSTRSSFLANWEKANGASGYLLDVSMDSSFRSYLVGYRNLDVGLVTGRVVTGLEPGRTYYFRARPYSASGPGNYSEVSSAATVGTTGLIIHATFDSSITSNANAAAIEAMINRCISIYESLFSDPVTIQILFRYTTIAPDGHPLGPGATARSDNPFYIIAWNSYVAALRADARTSNDDLANASLPGTALSSNFRLSSANGRAVGLDTPPAMFANGTVGNGGPYDGIVTLNSGAPFQFTRPVAPSNFDAQRETEHEIDEVMGLGSAANISFFHTQDLFSWSSAGVRNISSNGTRYFSINGGVTNIVNLNQSANGDLGDWLSGTCPQTAPFVQNASDCPGQSSDIAATSPEGIDLDVIGYDLVGAPFAAGAARAAIIDFNGDGHPDYVLHNVRTLQTAIWYLNDNIFIGGADGPTLPAGWGLSGVADFNRDSDPDYALVNRGIDRTAIWYLSGTTFINGAYGPDLPSGWKLVATADFNADGFPDYVLFNATTRQTAIWYLNNNVYVIGVYGPTLPVGWSLIAVADFDRDGHPDYLLFNSGNHQTAIWYLSGPTFVRGAYGPTISSGWVLVATADFNSDAHPDYLLYNPVSRQTAIWYLNNNVYVIGAYGPTVPAGWSLVGP